MACINEQEYKLLGYNATSLDIANYVFVLSNLCLHWVNISPR